VGRIDGASKTGAAGPEASAPAGSAARPARVDDREMRAGEAEPARIACATSICAATARR
jgi:hypothetical protein